MEPTLQQIKDMVWPKNVEPEGEVPLEDINKAIAEADELLSGEPQYFTGYYIDKEEK